MMVCDCVCLEHLYTIVLRKKIAAVEVVFTPETQQIHNSVSIHQFIVLHSKWVHVYFLFIAYTILVFANIEDYRK